MAQKRMLLVGTILVSAAIGVPTMAMLAPGGGVSEAPSPAVEPAEPDPVPPEPVDEQALPFPAVSPAISAAAGGQRPPAESGAEVPSHLGETAAPPRITSPPRKPATRPAEENEPQPPDPEPVEEETVVPPPTLPSDPDDADTDDHPGPPGGPVQDDQDPADEGDDPADR